MTSVRDLPSGQGPAAESGRRTSFIVRLWQETGTDFWRGSVTEASGGETLLFDNLVALANFMSRHTGFDLAQ